MTKPIGPTLAHRFRRALLAQACAACFVALAYVANASFYAFTKIADTSDGLSSFSSKPRINEAGVAVFVAMTGSGDTGVFTGSGGSITPIMLSSGPLTPPTGGGTGVAPGINDDRVVAFVAAYDISPYTMVLFKGSGGPLTAVYDSGTTTLDSLFGAGVMINNSNVVAFYSVLDGPPVDDGVFSGTGGATYTAIAHHAGPTFNAPFNPYPSLNNAGVVAFKANLDAGGSAIAKGSGVSPTIIATTAELTFSAFYGDPDINEVGQVVFMATRDAGGSGIFLGDGSAVPIPFASTDDGFSGFTGDVALNDAGGVIFKGSYGGSLSIFNGPNPVASRVVGPGIELSPGVFASGVSMINGCLNTNGSFAFWAKVSGSGEGIYRADFMAGNHAPLSSAIPSRVVHAGSLVTLTATASDPDVPADTLTFSLDPGAPGTASINATNGVFTWTPTDEDVGTTNAVTARVTDNGSPSLSNTKTFSIIVVSRPVIYSTIVTDVTVTLAWSAIAGQTYRVQYASDLGTTAWADLSGDVTATGSSATKDDSTGIDSQRFYRILLVP